MAFNKIQPEQIQMPTFFSDSGDLNITQTDTGVQINVSKNLTGNFAFTGQFTTNGKQIFGLPNTGDNSFSIDDGNLLIAGTNTEIGADSNNGDNIALYSVNGDISGSRNFLVHGSSTTFNTGSQDNVVLAGRGVTIATESTGSVIMKDSLSATSLTVARNHSLAVQFNSGHFFIGGQTYMGNHTSLAQSGIVSGNLDVIGNTLLSGNNNFGGINTFRGQSSVVFESDTLFSGENFMRGITHFETGFRLPEWGGNTSAVGVPANYATGAMAISGATLLIQTGYNLWGQVGIGTVTI
tara:strand:- start:3350 stop:4234 length:885 start_codon:yes stop_codon:yes gene_type:complete